MMPQRYCSLDTWRGIACVMIVVFHSGPYAYESLNEPLPDLASWFVYIAKQMWIGVPLFFVISGYCISASVDSFAPGEFNFRSYMLRRIRRIFPPYWAMLAIVVLLSILERLLQSNFLVENGVNPMIPPWWRSFWQLAGNVTLTEEWRHHLIGNQRGMILGIAWTLCYEEQFYLIIGVLASIAIGKRLLILLGLLTLLTLPFFGDLRFNGFFFDGYWLIFAWGCFTYFAIKLRFSKMTTFCWMILLVEIALYYSTYLGPFRAVNDLSTSLLVASLFGGLLVFLEPYDSWIQSTKLSSVFNWFGKRCYSLYLVHFPIVSVISYQFYHRLGLQTPAHTMILTMPICFIVSAISANCFHVSIERRFLYKKSS